MDRRVVIMANGEGSRMKDISPKPKHLLYYRSKRIIDHLLDFFPGAEVLTGKPSNSRLESLKYMAWYKEVTIVDCDIIPTEPFLPFNTDTVVYFETDALEYGSIVVRNCVVVKASEKCNISNQKCSGIYHVMDMAALIDEMTILGTDSIAEAMVGAMAIKEDSIIKLGDPDDYLRGLR